MNEMSQVRDRVRQLLVLVSVCAACLFAAAAAPSKARAALIFGSPPVGNVTTLSGANLLQVAGWAADPDAPFQAIGVRVDVQWYSTVCSGWGTPYDCISYLVSQLSYPLTASYWSSATAGTIWGPYHGFSATLKPPPVANSAWVTVTAINVGGGSDAVIGEGGACIMAADPFLCTNGG